MTNVLSSGRYRRSRDGRTGFTLIEVLVVISILGLLMALLLPAVQAAREAARRAQCANNLKQIGLALHNYHESNQTFPMNYSADLPAGFNFNAVRGYSALTRLLPYLEQQTLYASINYDVQPAPTRTDTAFEYPQNQTAYATTVGVYLCPSDGLSTPTPHGCNYRGNYGVGPSHATTAETYDSGNGFYNWPAVLSASSFPDGLSHTVAYSERLRGTGASSALAPDRDFGEINLTLYAVVRDADYALACCRYASAHGFPASRQAGFTWFFADVECTGYCHAQEPNGRIPDAVEIGESAHWGIATARSLHPGGVNALTADGSVRFVSESIARKVWRALGTRNGDELVE